MKKLILASILLFMIADLTLGSRGIVSFSIVSGIYFIAGMSFGNLATIKIWTKALILTFPTVLLISFAFSMQLFVPSFGVNPAGIYELLPTALLSVYAGLLVGKFWFARRKTALFLSASWLFILLTFVFWLLPPWFFYGYAAESKNLKSPNFTLQNLDKRLIKSTELEGKVILLDFWDTKCGWCIRMMPEFEQLYQVYKNHKEVRIFAVNTSKLDSLENVIPFKKEVFTNYSLPFVMDLKSSLTEGLGFNAFPSSCLIDKKGYVRLIHTGYLGWDEKFVYHIQKEIQKLLDE